jgi:hypothetical protein
MVVSPHGKAPTTKNKVTKLRNSKINMASRPPAMNYNGSIKKSATKVKRELPMVLYANDVGGSDRWMA